jgi:hypothetical protein
MTMTLAQRETQILSIIGKVTGPNQHMHFVNFTGLLWLSLTQIATLSVGSVHVSVHLNRDLISCFVVICVGQVSFGASSIYYVEYKCFC